MKRYISFLAAGSIAFSMTAPVLASAATMGTERTVIRSEGAVKKVMKNVRNLRTIKKISPRDAAKTTNKTRKVACPKVQDGSDVTTMAMRTACLNGIKNAEKIMEKKAPVKTESTAPVTVTE